MNSTVASSVRHGRWHDKFKNQHGAFDLPSIMIGVAVVAILTVGVLAAIFGVIPWAQDNAAKQDLVAVVNAESSYKVLPKEQIPAGMNANSFGSSQHLDQAELLPLGDSYCVAVTKGGDGFEAVSRSRTGTLYTVRDDQLTPVKLEGIPASECEHLDSPIGTEKYSGETIIGWASSSLDEMKNDEADFGVTNGMLSTYSDFVNEPDFPSDYARAAAARDASLLIAWEPYDWEVKSTEQPDFRPARIAAGRYDGYLESWLTEAQSYASKRPIMVRFAPEMNDAVRPWSVGVNGGNSAEDYVSMWRHVHGIKEQVAPDVIMVWNPLVAGSDPSGNPVSFESVYPGGEYVDVLALDGFNWADVQNPELKCGWQSYDDVFGDPIAQIKTLADGKPWGIAEVASVSKDDSFFREGGECYEAWGSWVYDWPESGDHYRSADDWITQAGWMKTMMLQAQEDGALFVNMFNTRKEADWRLNSTELGKKALVELKANEAFKTGGEKAGGLILGAIGR